jgi:enoyl-[acyl-carrier-protein] reductase (NADH)
MNKIKTSEYNKDLYLIQQLDNLDLDILSSLIYKYSNSIHDYRCGNLFREIHSIYMKLFNLKFSDLINQQDMLSVLTLLQVVNEYEKIMKKNSILIYCIAKNDCDELNSQLTNLYRSMYKASINRCTA